MKKNIVLVGLMGAGKTSVGKLLSEKLPLEFIDIDAEIEKAENSSICEIFKNKGEKYFRTIECEIISQFAQKSSMIISTGGGAVENEKNLLNLKENGFSIYLKATPEVLYERIKLQKTRPLVNNDKPIETLKELLEKREKNYLKAHVTIDTTNKNIGEITNEIVKVYNANC